VHTEHWRWVVEARQAFSGVWRRRNKEGGVIHVDEVCKPTCTNVGAWFCGHVVKNPIDCNGEESWHENALYPLCSVIFCKCSCWTIPCCCVLLLNIIKVLLFVSGIYHVFVFSKREIVQTLSCLAVAWAVRFCWNQEWNHWASVVCRPQGTFITVFMCIVCFIQNSCCFVDKDYA